MTGGAGGAQRSAGRSAGEEDSKRLREGPLGAAGIGEARGIRGALEKRWGDLVGRVLGDNFFESLEGRCLAPLVVEERVVKGMVGRLGKRRRQIGEPEDIVK
eukprot:CAMPEP_0201124748 /NCGR_PEP_ID=MMETSP0850-20130426/16976_1 /ASSEMBLY_ACC=CAM_ASM_000622 /TAXON_ID=183588 /ORGANISM="Pseudo-nitzschia fraudulenta, Strain WWA7" /LENGTH=101 /DNA_ID=CAMNT_0047392353 /DNA_START=410 /DNA_END=715 /DNA_ORIENTATION=-